MRVRNRLALATAALAPLLTFTAPAHADFTGFAEVVFAGDVTLATFPCSTPCTANYEPGLAAGTAVTSTATTVSAGVVTGLTASIEYTDGCLAGLGVLGEVTGVATLTGIGSALPLDVPFRWMRVGLVAVITSHPFSSTHPIVAGAALVVPQGFAPLCTGGAMTATVAGAAVAFWG